MASKNSPVIKINKSMYNEFISEFTNKLSSVIINELTSSWNEYLLMIKQLPKEQQEKLMTRFKISSLDAIPITELSREISEDLLKIKIGAINRGNDMRILEYIYGKRTPINTLITKLSKSNGIKELFDKYGK